MNARGAFTINEFCEWSRLGRTKTYELISSGELPVIKVGKKTLIRTADADGLLDKFSTKPIDAGKPTSSPEVD